ncbi:MAG: hypothetical protein ACKVOE_05345 [Rickettsiales bacterium]
MKKFVAVLATTTAMSLTTPVFAADASVKSETTLDHSKNGGYDKTTRAEKKTESGRVSSETETNLDVDNNGDTTKTTTTEDVNDPKGLLNKHSTKTKTKVKVEDGERSVEHTKKVDGKTVVDEKAKASN